MAYAWLFPDRVIGKRECRRLREEHNAVVNSHEDLLTAAGIALTGKGDWRSVLQRAIANANELNGGR